MTNRESIVSSISFLSMHLLFNFEVLRSSFCWAGELSWVGGELGVGVAGGWGQSPRSKKITSHRKTTLNMSVLPLPV